MTACGPIVTGTWLDDAPAIALDSHYLDRLRALGLEHVAVMVDGARPGLADQKWSTGELAKLAAALPGVRRIVSLWPTPVRTHLDEVRAALPSLLAALGSVTVDFDCEPFAGWKSKQVSGFVGLGDAGRAWVEMARECGAERVEVDTFPSAIPGAAGAIAAADVLTVQVYPVAVRDGKPVDYKGRLGPVRWPREALEAARKRFPRVSLVAGLPAYKQAWPGHHPGEAMFAAIASAAAADVKTCRWWSAKWLVRKATRSYAAPVLASLAG